MKGSLILLWCLAVASGFVLKVDEDDNQWKAWKDFHGKTYASESEETTRKAIWRDNHMTPFNFQESPKSSRPERAESPRLHLRQFQKLQSSSFLSEVSSNKLLDAKAVIKMKGSLILLWCLAVASGFVLKGDEDDNQWKAWKDFHGKTYASESEETTRKAIWRDNHMTPFNFQESPKSSRAERAESSIAIDIFQLVDVKRQQERAVILPCDFLGNRRCELAESFPRREIGAATESSEPLMSDCGHAMPEATLTNHLKISEHNAQDHSHVLAMNQFGDLTHDEYRTHYLAARGHFSMQEKRSYSSKLDTRGLPDTVDWREKGYVTPVKDQGKACSSSWAFSTTGALEGQHFKKTGKLVSLSEQNLIDCSRAYDNHGCQGGLMDNAFSYIKDNGGIDTEASYPYEGSNNRCRFKKSNVGATDTGFVHIGGSEEDLKVALAKEGPISVTIDASNPSFQFYKSGIYYEPSCSSENLDHGVLAVGYGADQNQGYWLVKNSWGTGWGDSGYIKMARDKNNQCGIASYASYPTV
ncbi:hypothetical protein OS493_027427 [Desmophyllum pertusum]|uniref:Uncharacterized protein n=1 Tax=Desmophyllum pertusum TaxID=174260 RepID=A0A9X0CIH6_9CNID|nr:hypothetical protein OS493_027427 [Desmophyllum pertusum]